MLTHSSVSVVPGPVVHRAVRALSDQLAKLQLVLGDERGRARGITPLGGVSHLWRWSIKLLLLACDDFLLCVVRACIIIMYTTLYCEMQALWMLDNKVTISLLYPV